MGRFFDGGRVGAVEGRDVEAIDEAGDARYRRLPVVKRGTISVGVVLCSSGYVGDVFRLMMKSEHIVLAKLVFLHLEKTGEVFFVNKDPPVHQNDIPSENGHLSSIGLLAHDIPALYDTVHKLGLFLDRHLLGI